MLWLLVVYSAVHLVYSGIIVPLETPNLRQIAIEMRPVAAPVDGGPIWHVLEHVADPLQLLREVARGLAPDGRFALLARVQPCMRWRPRCLPGRCSWPA